MEVAERVMCEATARPDAVPPERSEVGALRVTMMLADGAHATGGKLYVLGGGWSVMGPRPTAMAMALRFEATWDETDRNHEWELALIDADGRQVMCADHGTHPVQRPGQGQSEATSRNSGSGPPMTS